MNTQPSEAYLIGEAQVLAPFTKLVLTWHIETPEDSAAAIEGRVMTEAGYTDWISWGLWGKRIRRGCVQEDKQADNIRLEVDTLSLSDKVVGTGFQWRARLQPGQKGVLPAVRSFTPIGYGLEPLDKVSTHVEDLFRIMPEALTALPVPPISQMRRDPQMARVMCSPTSLTMIANYHGYDILPEEMALSVKDYDYGDVDSGYGNWSFNAAYLASIDWHAKVTRLSLRELMGYIGSGLPVSVSVAYSNEADHPRLAYIPNAPTTTPGHLIVVRGFERQGDQYKVLVNDPAAQLNEDVSLAYDLELFLQAWAHSGQIAYVVIPPAELAHDTAQAAFTGEAAKLKLAGQAFQVQDAAGKGVCEEALWVSMWRRNGDTYWQYAPKGQGLSLPSETTLASGSYEWIGFTNDFRKLLANFEVS